MFKDANFSKKKKFVDVYSTSQIPVMIATDSTVVCVQFVQGRVVVPAAVKIIVSTFQNLHTEVPLRYFYWYQDFRMYLPREKRYHEGYNTLSPHFGNLYCT